MQPCLSPRLLAALAEGQRFMSCLVCIPMSVEAELICAVDSPSYRKTAILHLDLSCSRMPRIKKRAIQRSPVCFNVYGVRAGRAAPAIQHHPQAKQDHLQQCFLNYQLRHPHNLQDRRLLCRYRLRKAPLRYQDLRPAVRTMPKLQNKHQPPSCIPIYLMTIGSDIDGERPNSRTSHSALIHFGWEVWPDRFRSEDDLDQ